MLGKADGQGLAVDTIAHLLAILMLGWLAALAAIVIGKAVFGSERHQGLLQAVRANGGKASIDPERVQLLAVFLGAAAFYFVEGVQMAAQGPVSTLPEASEALTIALTGSNAIYLSGKLIRT